jgi:DNA helicase-2/ATP-dependent DNA helicase PcrA
LTVHQAKGLEFPVVFVANMVETRFPARGRPPRLALAAELGGSDEIVPRDPRAPETPTALDEEALREERRLAYVALTRAREQLYLTASERATGGVRPRKVSRFISEALDLARTQLEETAFTGERSSAVAALEVAEPAAAVLPARAPGAAEQAPLTLSYTAIEAYLACPLRYHYQQRLRIPLPPHHAAIYGSALHAAVAEFHRGQMVGAVPESEALVEALNRSWQSAGFISRTHEEARYAAALKVLERFSDEERASGSVPAYVEKDFSFEIGGHKIRGRWDRVDVTPLASGERTREIPVIEMSDETLRPTLPLSDEWVVISDYKSGGKDDEEGNATRARDALQLQIYALAWRAATGRLPDEVSLRFLDSGKTATVPVDPKRIAKARDRIVEAAEGIQSGSMEAKPDRMNCTYCAYRELCPSSKAPAGRPS